MWICPAVPPTRCSPTSDLNEEAPHILFTPYLRDLCARITDGCPDALAKARAIYDYVTGFVDYRYQPSLFSAGAASPTCAPASCGGTAA